MEWKQYLVELMIEVRGNDCKICGGPFNEEDPATIDHIIPKSMGGEDKLSNFQLAHQQCNTVKGGHTAFKPTNKGMKYKILTDEQIINTLQHFPYRRGNRHIQEAAKYLGVNPYTIYRRLRKLYKAGKI